MKNHHFFNLYIKCAGLFLSFFIELNNFCLSRRLYIEGKYKFYLKQRLFFQITQQLPCFFLIWSGKRDRYKTAQGGGENVKPSDFQKTVMCRFDSCLKKTVFGVVKDYYKELKKNQAEAIPFCELPDIIIDKVAIWDTYKTDYTTLIYVDMTFMYMTMSWQKSLNNYLTVTVKMYLCTISWI